MAGTPYTLDWQIQQDLEDSKGMAEEERAKFLLHSINSHFLSDKLQITEPQQRPKEDSREVVVNTRRGGKSTELYNKALDKVIQGQRVLFAAPTHSMASFHFEEFVRLVKDTSQGYVADHSQLIVKVNNFAVAFIGTEGYQLRLSLDSDYDYKIMDDALSEFYEFDLVSVNGVIKK